MPIHYLCAAPRFIDLHHISPQPLIFKNDCMELAFCEIHSIALIRLFVLHPLMLSGSLEPEVVMSVRCLRRGHIMLGGLSSFVF